MDFLGLVSFLNSQNDENSEIKQYQKISFNAVTASVQEQQACEAVGGSVRQAGRLGAEHCIQQLPDAGKVCSDQSDCLGRCVLTDPDAHKMKADTPMQGVCEASDDIFGCTTLINGGKVEGTLCID